MQYSEAPQKALLPKRQHVAPLGIQLSSHACWPAGQTTARGTRAPAAADSSLRPRSVRADDMPGD